MKKICAIVAVVLLLTILSTCLFACEPPVYEGVTITGVAIDKDSPVAVTSCKITLDIVDLPEENDKPQQYSSTVTIDYQFNNPTNYDVAMQLHLPLKSPYYSKFFNLVYGDTQLIADEPIDVVTHCWYGKSYDNNNEYLLPNERLTDDYFNDSLVAYKYFYQVKLPYNDDREGVLEYTLGKNDKVVFDNEITYYKSHPFSDKLTMYSSVKNGDILMAYSFDKQMPEINLKFTETRDGELLKNAELKLLAEFTCTFEDVAFTYYDPSGTVNRTDWYNAVLKKLQDRGVNVYKSATQFDVTDDVRMWYDYTIVVPANGTANHTVTMPLFPDINYGYTPDVYEYYVNLKNLKSWASVGDIEIVANTDYYAVKDTQTTINAFGTDKCNWRLKFSTVPNPSSDAFDAQTVRLFVIFAIAVPEAIALAVVILVAVKTSPNKRKKADK